MASFSNLSSRDRDKVDQKLAELQAKTGWVWGCFVMSSPQDKDQPYLLEITIDGRSAEPIVLREDGTDPADRICKELEEFFARRSLAV